MKAIALKILMAALAVALPLTVLPEAESRTRVSVSYSSGHRGHGSSWHGRVSQGGYSSYGYRSHGHRSYGYRSYRPTVSYHYSNYPRYHRSYQRSYSRPSVFVNIGSGYRSGFYSSLPIGYTSCVVGGLTYYRHSGRYYRPYNTGYVVVADPYEVRSTRPTTVVTRSGSGKYDAYPRIWVNGDEYLIDEGELFKITRNGLVWAEIPLGAVASSLPTHATSVWYNEVEYFEAGGLYFQRIPEGYRIILPPWDADY